MTNPKKNRKIFNSILAVVLAVALWLYVINVENPTSSATIRDIPVTVVGEDTLDQRGLMVTGQSRDSVNLKLSGRKKSLMKLSRNNITLKLDVSAITAQGEHTLSCDPSYANNVAADSISVADLEDLQVTVTVEKEESKEIPVRGEFIGTEAEHCLAGTVTTNPATIQIKGPADTLDRISYALASVGGKSISDTLTETVGVVFMGPENAPADRRSVTASTETVEVTVPVRRVESLPLTVELTEGGGLTQDDIQVSISPKSITVVSGEQEDSLPASISLGEIDLRSVLTDASYSIPIRLPEGVTPWGKQSRYATVTLSLKDRTAKQLFVEEVSYQNVPEGYRVEPVTQGMFVWVRGSSKLVNELEGNQIKVTVDLSKAAATDKLQRFPAQVSLSGGQQGDLEILGQQYSAALRLHKK